MVQKPDTSVSESLTGMAEKLMSMLEHSMQRGRDEAIAYLINQHAQEVQTVHDASLAEARATTEALMARAVKAERELEARHLIFDVEAILMRHDEKKEGPTVHERRLIHRLLKVAASYKPGSIPGSVILEKTLYWPIPQPTKGDGELKHAQVERYAKLVQELFTQLQLKTQTFAKVLKQNRVALSEAALQVHFHPQLKKLSVEDTETIVLNSGMTGKGWEQMNATLRFLGHFVPFAPARHVKLKQIVDSVKCAQQWELPMFDKHGVLITAAAMVQCLCEIYCSELDRCEHEGLRRVGFMLRSDLDANVRHAMWSQDKGDQSIKFVLKNVGVEHNQSVDFARIFALFQPLYNKKAADVYRNWMIILPYVHGLGDFPLNAIVQAGNGSGARHLLVPKNTIPLGALPLVAATSDDVTAIERHRGGHRDGTPQECEAQRASAIHESAVLLTRGDLLLGARISLPGGGCTYWYVSFRAPVQSNVLVTIVRLRVFQCMDLLAAAVAEGMEGQDNCNCLNCDFTAKMFKEATWSANSALSPRTAATQAAHLATYNAQTAKKKLPIYGVSAAPAFPELPPDDKPPPSLHLLLGAGNAFSAFFTKGLEKIDNKDPVAIQKASELRDVIAELDAGFAVAFAELTQLEADATRSLGGDGAEAEVEDQEDGEDEGDKTQSICMRVYEAATRAALQLKTNAKATRLGDPNRAVATRGARQIARDEAAAGAIEEEARALEEKAESAMAAAIALDEAKAEYKSHATTTGLSGRLAKIYAELLSAENIEKEVYWNGQLVGPHLWRLFKRYWSIFAKLKARATHPSLGYDPADLDALIGMVSPGFAALAALEPLMRATRLLTDAELDSIDTNCAALGATWRLHFAIKGKAAHTPKIHCFERHVPAYARLHGTLGMFGEESVEALHPAWTAAARICRAIRDPKAKLLATKRRVEAKQRCKAIVREKKSRQSKKARTQAAM